MPNQLTAIIVRDVVKILPLECVDLTWNYLELSCEFVKILPLECVDLKWNYLKLLHTRTSKNDAASSKLLFDLIRTVR